MLLSSIPELNSVLAIKGQPEPAAPVVEDEFEKFQKEIIEAEAEVGALKGSAEDGGVNQEIDERPATPPDGEEEFMDDYGTVYKWDRTLRKWVPQLFVLAENKDSDKAEKKGEKKRKSCEKPIDKKEANKPPELV